VYYATRAASDAETLLGGEANPPTPPPVAPRGREGARDATRDATPFGLPRVGATRSLGAIAGIPIPPIPPRETLP
jgi:hypothetical protein